MILQPPVYQVLYPFHLLLQPDTASTALPAIQSTALQQYTNSSTAYRRYLYPRTVLWYIIRMACACTPSHKQRQLIKGSRRRLVPLSCTYFVTYVLSRLHRLSYDTANNNRTDVLLYHRRNTALVSPPKLYCA